MIIFFYFFLRLDFNDLISLNDNELTRLYRLKEQVAEPDMQMRLDLRCSGDGG